MARSKLALGIELVGDEVRLVLVESGEKGLAVRTAQTVTAGEDLVRVFRSFPRRPDAVTSAVSLEHAAIRILNLPPTTEENLDRVIGLEAEGTLPLDSEELALSHHVMGITEQSRLEALLAAARLGAVRDVLRRVNCAPWVSATVTVTSMALLNAVEQLYGSTRETACAVLRVEESGSELLVLDRQRVVLTQSIPVGCGAVAERVPVGVGGGGEYVSEAWTSELSQQVRYALQALSYERGLAVRRLYVCGKGVSDAGAAEALGAGILMPVSVLSAEGEEDPKGAPYAVAYGCAVQAAGNAAVPLNLTPVRVTVAREVEQRRQARISWAALAGAVVLAAGLVFGAMVQNRQRHLELLQAQLREVGGAAAAPAMDPGELKDASAALDEALETRVSAGTLLGMLNRQLPAGTWLAELTYNAETGSVVRGYSTEPNGAQRAQIALLRQAVFDEVTLDYRTQEQIGTVPVWGFQLTCRLRPEQPQGRARPRAQGAGR